MRYLGGDRKRITKYRKTEGKTILHKKEDEGPPKDAVLLLLLMMKMIKIHPYSGLDRPLGLQTIGS